MKIKIGKYTIEDDNYGYKLSETRVMEKGNNIGEEYETDMIFPSTLENCIKRIRERKRISNSDLFTLEEYTREIKQLDEDFLIQLKEIIGNT